MNQIAHRTTRTADTSASGIRRQVILLGLPVLVEQSLLYLVGFSDTLLTGRFLGVEELAAVTVGSYLMWFLGSLVVVASAGGTALVSRSVGASDFPAASRLSQQALLLGLLAGCLMLALGWPLAPHLARGLGLADSAATAATTYIRIVLLAAPALAWQSVGIACLRGAGDTRTGMWAMSLMNAVNVALSWTLAVGPGPLPALGLAGIAAGTALGELAGALMILVVLARGRAGLRFHRNDFLPRPADLRRLLRISLPAAAESATNSPCQLWFLRIINTLGDTATAAHGVAIRCEAIAFLTVAAFAIPASTLTGQFLGARQPDAASRAARTAAALAALVLSLLGLALYLLARPLFHLFLGGGQPAVAELGIPALRLVAFAMPVFAVMVVLSAAMRGAGETRVPMLIVLSGYLLIRIPLTYLLARPESAGPLALGLLGAWVAMVADIAVRGSLVTAYFATGRWKRVRV